MQEKTGGRYHKPLVFLKMNGGSAYGTNNRIF